MAHSGVLNKASLLCKDSCTSAWRKGWTSSRLKHFSTVPFRMHHRIPMMQNIAVQAANRPLYASYSSQQSLCQRQWLPAVNKSQLRTYLHFVRAMPDDYELPIDTLPSNLNTWMKKDPKDMDFFENYWYWRIRGESTLMDPESLPKKSYAQLARDLGLQIVKEESEHMVGLLELYEYLKSSPFIGPFGTIEKPVLVPSVHTERIVGCTGGTGDNEHIPLWFRCREGFLYRCGECDQIFMLVRVIYSLPEGEDPFPVDPDLDDVFDLKLVEQGQKMWNSGEYSYWEIGQDVSMRLFKEAEENAATSIDRVEPLKLDKHSQH